MNWYVLYTKSRNEKAVAEKLRLQGIEVYCPLLKTRKLWSDRWKWVEEPLFRSYCFVLIDESRREDIFAVQGVVRYVYYCGKPAIVRQAEMETLQDWLNKYDHESIESKTLDADDRILIRSGAFLDRMAKVIEAKGRYALLYMEDLGIRVKVDLKKNLVERM